MRSSAACVRRTSTSRWPLTRTRSLDSYIYGFAATQLALPFTAADAGEVAESMLRPFSADAYPHLTEMLTDHVMQPGYDYADEFELGLDLILGGLERTLETARERA